MSPRGEFAPPTLRPHPRPPFAQRLRRTEGRIRPSYIAAREGERPLRSPSAPRGEFAPPTLRPACGQLFSAPVSAPRGEFAPPTLRPLLLSVEFGLPAGTEGRIRPSPIAARRFADRSAISPIIHVRGAGVGEMRAGGLLTWDNQAYNNRLTELGGSPAW